MMKAFNPGSIAAPVGSYVHGMEVPPGARVLYVSGQVGIKPDGSIDDDTAGQTKVIFDNIAAILTEGGMGMTDIVKMSTFLTEPDDLADHIAVRKDALGGHTPTSTLVFVPRLVKAEWKVEVEVIAATAT